MRRRASPPCCIWRCSSWYDGEVMCGLLCAVDRMTWEVTNRHPGVTVSPGSSSSRHCARQRAGEGRARHHAATCACAARRRRQARGRPRTRARASRPRRGRRRRWRRRVVRMDRQHVAVRAAAVAPVQKARRREEVGGDAEPPRRRDEGGS